MASVLALPPSAEVWSYLVGSPEAREKEPLVFFPLAASVGVVLKNFLSKAVFSLEAASEAAKKHRDWRAERRAAWRKKLDQRRERKQRSGSRRGEGR